MECDINFSNDFRGAIFETQWEVKFDSRVKRSHYMLRHIYSDMFYMIFL